MCRSTFSLLMQAPVLTKHWVRNTASRLSFSSRTRQQRGLAAAQRESQSRSLRLVGPNGVTSIAPDQVPSLATGVFRGMQCAQTCMMLCQEVLIGSDPQCDIHIESAPGTQFMYTVHTPQNGYRLSMYAPIIARLRIHLTLQASSLPEHWLHSGKGEPT